jgi:hypothetical protein
LKLSTLTKRTALGVLTALSIVAGLIGPVAVPVAAAGTSMAVSPSQTNLNINDEFDVTLVVDSDIALLGGQAAVTFDQTVLEVVSTTDKGLLFKDYVVANGGTVEDNIITSPSGSITTANTTGQTGDLGVSIVGMGAVGPTDGTFWTLHFRAIANGDSSIGIANGNLVNTDGQVIPGASFTAGNVHVGPMADLTVTELTREWIDMGAGTYKVNFKVKNIGTADSAECTAAVEIDSVELDTVTIPALTAEEEVALTADGPFTLSDNSDSVVIMADSTGAVSESNETNNELTATLYAAGMYMYTSPDAMNKRIGDEFDVNIVIDADRELLGAQAAIDFDETVLNIMSITHKGELFTNYVTANGGTVEDNIIEYPHGSISNANTTGQTGDLGVSIVGMGAQGPTGGIFWTLHFKAIADGTSPITIVNEAMTDTAGNIIPGAIITGSTVTVGAALPDLTVTTLTTSWEDPDAGSYYVQFTIKNIGTLAPSASSARLTIDGVAIESAIPVSALAANAQQVFELGPYTMSGESDTITVEANNTEAFAEITADNNTLTTYLASTKTIIEGNIVSKIIMSVPASIVDWELQVGNNSITRNLNIKSNSDWVVNIKEDSIRDMLGHLTEWDGSSYLSRALANPLALSCDGKVIPYLTADDQPLADGITADQNGDDGENFVVTFSQEVEFQDARLGSSAGTVYHLVITFVATNTF